MRFEHFGVIGEITNLPGCSQVGVFHSVFATPLVGRGKGFGSKAHKARLNEAKILGYDCGLCTVTCDNIAQQKILQKNGWRHIHTFLSSKTGNDVMLYVKAL